MLKPIMIALTVGCSAIAMLMLDSCQDRQSAVQSQDWGEVDGKPVHLFTLTNADGMTAAISDYGCIIVRLTAPDRAGHFSDVVLGYNTLEEYRQPGHSPYFGAITGRYGNRIAGGHFSLDGTPYTLATNNAPAGIPCSLHGGLKGFDKVVWNATPKVIDGDQALELTYRSVDGEEGYPGNLDVTVTYRLTVWNELRIDYRASTDKATVLNLSNHSYFNLRGEGEGDILGTQITIPASRMTPVTKAMIPTGELGDVAGTPFDFTTPHTIGERIDGTDQQLVFGTGYDHNWVLDQYSTSPEIKAKVPYLTVQNMNEPGQTLTLGLAARAEDPVSGRILRVFTSEPGVQFYTANWYPLPSDPADKQMRGKSGRFYYRRNAFAIETQHFPDSPNQPKFPTTVLRPGTEYQSTTIFAFRSE